MFFRNTLSGNILSVTNKSTIALMRNSDRYEAVELDKVVSDAADTAKDKAADTAVDTAAADTAKSKKTSQKKADTDKAEE